MRVWTGEFVATTTAAAVTTDPFRVSIVAGVPSVIVSTWVPGKRRPPSRTKAFESAAR